MLYSDHVIVLVVAVLYPVAGYLGFQRLLARLRAGIPVNRSALYRKTVLGHWVMALVVLYLWTSSERSSSDLGLDLSLGPEFLAAVVIALLCIGALAAQMVTVLRADQDTIDNIGESLGSIAAIVPHSGREMKQFYFVSVTAGIVEELLWRGYLMWYLGHYVSTVVAALIVTLGFGLAHAYQGWRNIPKITLVSAVFTVLYLISGSIWLSMLLHIVVDAMQGRLAFVVSQRSRNGLLELPDS